MNSGLGMINAFNPSKTEDLNEQERSIVSRRAKLLGPAYRLFYEHPVQVVKGEGVWLQDAQGRKYLDAYNNVPSVGHCHPHVVKAITQQLAVLNTHTRYMQEGILDFAEMLLATFPAALSQVMFTCSGSEANDLAVRVAKNFTAGTGFIVTSQAYHGVTETIAGMSPSLGTGVPLNPGVYTVRAPLCPTIAESQDAVAERFLSDVLAALQNMKMEGIKPAALLVDTIFSSDGVFSDPTGFLAPAVEAVREAGGIFIADEVQAGFGRTGEAFWGFQRHKLVPDIVTMGKPMGNGYPIAAMVARPEVLADFGRKTRYFNTFGGSTVAIAAARAVLEVIQSENLMENAASTGAYTRNSLIALSRRHPLLGAVRGAGQFTGIDIIQNSDPRQPAEKETAQIVNGLRERGVLISASGAKGNVLKIRPPLSFGKADASFLMDALDGVLTTLST